MANSDSDSDAIYEKDRGGKMLTRPVDYPYTYLGSPYRPQFFEPWESLRGWIRKSHGDLSKQHNLASAQQALDKARHPFSGASPEVYVQLSVEVINQTPEEIKCKFQAFFAHGALVRLHQPCRLRSNFYRLLTSFDSTSLAWTKKA